MPSPSWSRTTCVLALLCIAFAVEGGQAVALDAAGIAWIDKCVSDRAKEKLDPGKLRDYCACMQEIVEDNEPFTVSELEHSYPPAHVMCTEEAGLLR